MRVRFKKLMKERFLNRIGGIGICCQGENRRDACKTAAVFWGMENQVKWQRNINITNFPHAWETQAWGKGRGESYTLFQTLPVSLNRIGVITKLKSNMKGALMSVSDRLLLRKRAIIETVNDELKNIAQVEHSRHRCFDNFIVNLLEAIAAYCLFPKKPCINVQSTIDTQLALF